MYNPNNSVRLRVSEAANNFHGEEACWEWPKSRTKAGYGQLSTSAGSADKRELHYAHRVSYLIHCGDIPDGMNICHKCDNPACFNPHHLFLGSQADNVRDCIQKGRINRNKKPMGDKHWTRSDPQKFADTFKGENNAMAKLKEENVVFIRASKDTHASLARMFGVAETTIGDIRKRRSWAWLV